MTLVLHDLRRSRERILRGEHGWWFLGPGGVARLEARHLTESHALRPEAEERLRGQGLFTAPAYRMYSLTVLTSTACNLGCGYCFQNTGQDPSGGARPPRIARTRLSSGTITSILEFTRARMEEAGLDRLGIMLFGGEPLLNPRGCRELLARGADYGLSAAALTSNATLLTPTLAKELHGLGLKNVQVTFDGDRDSHDRIRTTRSGGATFDEIVDNVARVSEQVPLKWILRVNVSHLNRSGIDGLIERLASRIEPTRCTLGFARVEDLGVGYSNEAAHDAALADEFSRWQRHSLELGFGIGRPRARTPCQACSVKDGRFGAVVSADGSLSSCWDTAGKPEWTVGNVADGYLPAAVTGRRWISCDSLNRGPDDVAAAEAFQDRVDAALLDYLSATGRL